MLDCTCYPKKRILSLNFLNMWFFDSVLEETPNTVNPSLAQTKKSEQDGSFLIINDSVNTDAIPDTAVQLFDAAPEVTSSPESEVSFFSEPVVAPVEDSVVTTESVEEPVSAEIEFFTESTVAPTAPVEAETVSETDNLISFMDESSTPTPSIETTTLVEDIQSKDDINGPLQNAIKEYNGMLDRHMKIATAKDQEIADFNEQVAIAKAGAKKALEERKSLETEMDRIRQMKELFSAQLK